MSSNASSTSASATTANEAARAADLPEPIRQNVRDLILCLADSKRLLGMRYADWILGAPELEAGIACASMAQDEWGHARLLYAMLREFGDDTEHVEHERAPAEYQNMQVLDTEPHSWAELVAINALVDTAISVQLEALAASAYIPLRQRVQKLLDEEQFHAAHGTAWVRRFARANDDARAELAAAIDHIMEGVLTWFGPDSDTAAEMTAAGIANAAGSDLRAAFVERVAPLLREVDGEKSAAAALNFDSFDESRRRTPDSMPDERTIAKLRGDKNRAFLMD